VSLYYATLALFSGVDYASGTFPVFQPDGVTPEPLTGYSARLMLRVNRSDEEAQLSLTAATPLLGIITLGGAQGTVSFTITKVGIAEIEDHSGVWDLFIDSNDAVPVTTAVVSGTWTLTESATQP
jgi:hypothetical protein